MSSLRERVIDGSLELLKVLQEVIATKDAPETLRTLAIESACGVQASLEDLAESNSYNEGAEDGFTAGFEEACDILGVCPDCMEDIEDCECKDEEGDKNEKDTEWPTW